MDGEDNRSEREILLSIEKRVAYLEHQQKVSTRLAILKIAVIVAIIAVLAVVVTPYIRSAVEDYRALMEQVDKLSTFADSMGASFDSFMDKLDPVLSFFKRG